MLSEAGRPDQAHRSVLSKPDLARQEVETVKLDAINHGYNVEIGVAGPQGVDQGDFTLKLKLAK